MQRWAAAIALVAVALTGCGGGDKRADAEEPEGMYTVDIVDASFPVRQRLADQTSMDITVRNADSKRVPNVAVTIESAEGAAPASPFGQASSQTGLADPSRPIWVVDAAPRGGTTAYTNTWSLGPLQSGQSKTFSWRVTAVKPGTHTVRYKVAAGLGGKAKAQLAGGQRPVGSFTVNIDRKPANQRVDDAGNVVPEGRRTAP